MLHKKASEFVEEQNNPAGTWRWTRCRSEGPRSFELDHTVSYEDADVAAWMASQKAKTANRGAR
jgi:hypothetical protein